MITEILSGLDRPDLPSGAAASLNLPSIAFKTGTSYGRRDALCVGYSAEFTAGVWLGNVNNEGNAELVGSRAATPLLVDILNALTTPGLKRITAAPSDAGLRLVCARSGLLPTRLCRQLIEDSYSRSRTQPAPCNVCVGYMVAPDGSATYCQSCVTGHPYVEASFEEYQPEVIAFWKTIGRRPPVPPPHYSGCTRVFAGDGPGIMSPSDGMTYYLMRTDQKLCLQASSGIDVREHVWYVDDRYIGRTTAADRLFVDVGRGEHAVVCVDDRGRSSRVRIRIVQAS
jgi:penicillin-binding protein 1C